jgi:hypothetical protein
LLKKMTVLVRILASDQIEVGPGIATVFQDLAVRQMRNQYQRRLEGQLKSCAAIGKSAAHGFKTAWFNAFSPWTWQRVSLFARAPRTPIIDSKQESNNTRDP